MKSGLALLALFATAWVKTLPPPAADLPPTDPVAMDSVCPGRDSIAKRLCLDSLEDSDQVETGLAKSDPDAALRQERAAAYAARFVADVSTDVHSSGDWAEAIFVAAGVVVVGAVVLYLPKLIYDYVTDRQTGEVFKEAALRYAYTGSSWDGGGSPLYRGTHLASARMTLGVQEPVLGMGLTLEGGYLSTRLEEIGNHPGRVSEMGGPFILLGPTVRFGSNPFTLGFDFLNGSSWVQETGWITEGWIFGQARLGKRFLLGAYVGALFYDLRFFDGLVWREGSFNRDLSLLAGLEYGFAF